MTTIYPTNRYVPGTYKTQCTRCGFDTLRSKMLKEPDTNLIVCPDCFDPANPRLKPRIRGRERFLKIDTGHQVFSEPKNIIAEDGSPLVTEDGDNLVWE